MREIKFRGKGLASGEWYIGDLIQDIKGKAWIITDDYSAEEIILNTCASPEIDKSTIGQYTGLKDKNGKEIYEGDIVKGIVEEEIEVRGIVGYSQAEYIIIQNNNDEWDLGYLNNTEIIRKCVR